MTAAAVSTPRSVRSNRFRFGPLWLAAPGLAFLLIFFLVPVARLMGLSLEDADTGAMTASHYARIFETDVYFRVLLITFRIAGLTTLFSLLLGYPLAYWLSRLPDRTRGTMILLVMVPFWTSYLVKSFAWVIVLGRTGIINQIGLGSGVLSQPLELLHNELGVMIGMVHAMVPLAILTMLPVMTGIDRRLTQASATLGATPAKGFWLVYFPLSLPGAAAAGLLTFISSLGFFIVPALLGGRQQTMLAQLIIVQVQEILNWAFAGALAAMMLLAALVTCWVYDRVFGLSSLSGEPSDGKAGKTGFLRALGLAILDRVASISSAIASGSHRLLGAAVSSRMLGIYSVLLFAFLMLPTLVVLPIAFTSSQFLEFPPPGYGLEWFRTYFTSDLWVAATIRSFGVAFATAIVATVIGGFAALALARSRSRWRGIIFAFFLAPMIVPRIVIAVGLFYLFAQMGLVATDLGLVIGHTVLALPFAFVAIAAVLKSYDWRLDQAAATLGANRVQALRFVTVPLIKSGLTAAFLFAFITSFDELTVAIFVSGGVKTTLPKQMWDDMILQLNPTLAAVSVVVFIVVTTLLLAAEKLRRST
ncbi:MULTISPECIES: ABC transporter permease subunit [Ensifer]|uniref:ABC transporter permease subunit n=1 Tax=Ensifer canadensis TaxID=555315 RepID=A0AAW4FQ90_9HYPH|nr:MULTISPECIES: ABC transporter permease subunit [Ensifer]MDP9633161.1 ABC-type spermidine/putrescine transport system permease subunit I [Ensifer adhaerens]KQU94579.1 ABC transporter permease [Ensifer sp. Root31]KQY74958.1 ABC transporter permease [Ensifer sp. Root142]MBD9489804.1 ABC transporter permease subunit [Ensifer sp. ENS11]MBM3093450.1 ABC transporter permease subunit [Ensifer canadensis]